MPPRESYLKAIEREIERVEGQIAALERDVWHMKRARQHIKDTLAALAVQQYEQTQQGRKRA